jgi:hypothetical protein
VLVGGDPVIWITVGAGPYTPQYRADRIAERLHTIVRDRSISDPRVTITENEGSSELYVGPRLLMVVTPQDSRSLGVARASLGDPGQRPQARSVPSAPLAPATLMRSGVYGGAATLALAVSIWILFRVTLRIRNLVYHRWRQHGSLRVQNAEIVSANRIGQTIYLVVRIVRAVWCCCSSTST